MSKTHSFDIAIVGLGFSGAAVFAKLTDTLTRPVSICLIDAGRLSPCGVAYSTTRPEHLLNVRASHMSMDANKPDDFTSWLAGRYQPHEFAPRMIYGDYLKQRFNEAMAMAKSAGHHVQYYHDDIVRMDESGNLIAESGRIFMAAHTVLANGLRFSKRWAEGDVCQPWSFEPSFFANKDGAVVIIGSGLTAVDTILSLLGCQFRGKIICVSPRGHFPMAHSDSAAKPDIPSFPQQLRLSLLVQMIRRFCMAQPVWQDALDALRPHTTALWQRLSASDQRRALTRYLHWWNIHRHRMAPEIAVTLQKAQSSGQLIRIRGRFTGTEQGRALVRKTDGVQSISCDAVIDCSGPSYATPFSVDVSSLIAGGNVRIHESAAGFAANETCRISTKGSPEIYAMGALLTGQLLETTAVPELRKQAAWIAEAIVNAIRPA